RATIPYVPMDGPTRWMSVYLLLDNFVKASPTFFCPPHRISTKSGDPSKYNQVIRDLGNFFIDPTTLLVFRCLLPLLESMSLLQRQLEASAYPTLSSAFFVVRLMLQRAKDVRTATLEEDRDV